MDELSLKKEILSRVEALAALRGQEKPPFVPGESRINYAGRVYDEKELVNLVDAALEFWLTAGAIRGNSKRSWRHTSASGGRFREFGFLGESAGLYDADLAAARKEADRTRRRSHHRRGRIPDHGRPGRAVRRRSGLCRCRARDREYRCFAARSGPVAADEGGHGSPIRSAIRSGSMR